MNQETPAPEFTPVSKPVPTASAIPTVPAWRRLLPLITIGLLLIATALGVYGYLMLDKHNRELTNRVAALEQSAAPKPAASSDKPADPKALTAPDDMAGKLLDYLKSVHDQTGEYPESLSPDADKLLWRYNYNQVAMPITDCTNYARYFSYSGYKNLATQKVDNFDMYYCKNGQPVKKTQLDIK